MLYIDKQVRSSQISLKSCSSGDFEFLCCKLHPTNSKFVGIMCVYRPPNISYTGDMFLINVINEFLDLNIPYNVVIGDFNMPLANWMNFTGPQKITPFLNCCTDHYLTKNVRESTRPNSDSLLDIIFLLQKVQIYDVRVEECFGPSDPSILNFTITLQCFFENSVNTRSAEPVN